MSMSAGRRMQMVILSAPRVLESVRSINIKAPMNNEKFSGLSRQFIPWLKYHNPKIEWNWEVGSNDAETENGVLTIEFSDNSTTSFSDSDYASFHELCQALLDADTGKSAQLKTS